MKKILISLTLVATSFSFANAQGGVAVNNSGTTPNANAMLDVDSDSKGILIPRITTIARTALGGAMGLGENGMLVYDKDLLVFYYWDGTQWVLVGNGTGTDDQNLTGATLTGTSLQIDIENGNSATVDLSSLQDGTGTDNQDLTLSGDILSLSNDATTVDLSTLKDHDWYEVGGTTQADAITDDIFTQGNVGIGTITPLSTLDVQGIHNQIKVGNLNQAGAIQFARGTDGFYSGKVGFSTPGDAINFDIANTGGGGEVNIITNNGSSVAGGFNVSSILGTNPGTHMTVRNTGNVGIGTTTPNRSLVIDKSSGTRPLQFESNSDNGLAYGWRTSMTGFELVGESNGSFKINFDQDNNSGGEFFQISENNGNNPLMTILSGGNVGIGTTTPTDIVQLASNAPKLNLQDLDATLNTDGHNQSLYFTDQNNNLTGKMGFGTANQVMFIQNGNSGGSIRFSANAITSNPTDIDMVIETSGNVGIGTNTPTERLDVTGSVKIVDGTQGVGKVLTSDANGRATWEFGGVPAGAIMAFDLATCPTGWAAADGTAGTPDLRGEFIRGLDNGRGVDVGRTLNSGQLSATPNITGNFYNIIYQGNFSTTNANGVFSGTGPGGVRQSPSGVNADAPTGEGISFDASQSSPIYQNGVTEARPRNVALLYCKKQ